MRTKSYVSAAISFSILSDCSKGKVPTVRAIRQPKRHQRLCCRGNLYVSLLTRACPRHEREDILFGVVLTEVDANKAVYDAHFKTDYFTQLGSIIPQEGLVAKPLDIMTIKPVAGFASR